MDDKPIRLIVRSSAIRESFEERGRYVSAEADASVESLESAIEEVWTGYAVRGGPVGELALVIQHAVKPLAFGHLSNERRLSARDDDWHYEYYSENAPAAHSNHFVGASPRPDVHPLWAESVDELLWRFTDVTRFVDRGKRYHFEWVWDGARVWIVQRDEEPPFEGSRPGSQFVTHGKAPPVDGLKALQPWQEASHVSKKTDNYGLFQSLGLPTTKLFVLHDPHVIAELASGRKPPRLIEDLQKLLAWPIVIRSDVTEASDDPGFLLPRTDCVRTLEEALTFLVETSRALLANKPCFLIHHYISSEVAAWATSRPDASETLVDASWGIADGLQSCPCDSWIVPVDSAFPLQSRIRAKTDYIDVNPNGQWVQVHAGDEWVWRPCLAEQQVRDLAEATKKIAVKVGKPVGVMFFVRVDPDSGHPSWLPWYLTTETIYEFGRIPTGISEANSFRVTDNADLTSLQEKIRHGEEIGAIRLRPDVSVLRDQDFIEEVAKFAVELDLTVELEGSALTHVYYVLRREGARVLCLDVMDPEPVQTEYNKLVRDMIPEQMAGKGLQVFAAHARERDRLDLLKQKLVEEALEAFDARHKTSMVAELSDVLEIVKAIGEFHGLRMEDLQQHAQQKARARGGFSKGVVLLSATAFERPRPEKPLFAGEGKPTVNLQTLDRRLLAQAQPTTGADRLTIEIPLVPPTTRSSFEFSGGRLQATVRYREKDVILQISASEQLRPLEAYSLATSPPESAPPKGTASQTAPP